MKVLTIDPDGDTRDMISVAFRLHWEGIKVIEAAGGNEGQLLLNDEGPDIVILELELPDIDGMELCHQMLRQYDVPIVVLSVRGDEEDIVQALRAGALGYMIKPFHPREMVARIEAVLRRHRLFPKNGCWQRAPVIVDHRWLERASSGHLLLDALSGGCSQSSQGDFAGGSDGAPGQVSGWAGAKGEGEVAKAAEKAWPVEDSYPNAERACTSGGRPA